MTVKTAVPAARSAAGSRPTSTTAEATGPSETSCRFEPTSTASATLANSSVSTEATSRPSPLWSTPVAQFLELPVPQLAREDLLVLGLEERQKLSDLSRVLGVAPTEAVDRVLRRLLYGMPVWAERTTFEALSFYLQQMVVRV